MEDLRPRKRSLQPWQWSLLFAAAVAGGLFVLALFHREKPLAANELPSTVLSQLRLRDARGAAWKNVTWESLRTYQSEGQSVEVVVRYRLENLGNGLVRRTDDWYPRYAGNAVIYEERYLMYANLVSLESRYREPAPGFHAIMADTGWLSNRLQAARISEAQPDPTSSDWQLDAHLDWMRDPQAQDRQGTPEHVTRDTQCRTLALATAKRPQVKCAIRQSDGMVRSTSFVYVKEVGLFFVVSFNEQWSDGGGSVDATANIRALKVDGAALDL